MITKSVSIVMRLWKPYNDQYWRFNSFSNRSTNRIINVRHISWLSKCADLNPLNEEWKSVGLCSKQFGWINVIRKELVSSLQSIIVDNPMAYRSTRSAVTSNQNSSLYVPHCAVILGPKGSGRSTAVNQAIEASQRDHILFDFESINHQSFTPFLVEFYTKIFEQLEQIIVHDPLMTQTFSNLHRCAQHVFKALMAVHPEFQNVLKNFIRDTVQQRYPSTLASSPKILNQLKVLLQTKYNENTSPEGLFIILCSALAKIPTGWAYSNSKDLTLCLSLIIIIAEYEENSIAYINTNQRIQFYPTAERSLRYILTVLSAMNDSIKKPICLVFKNVDVLSRSPFLQERGYAFLTNLVDFLTHKGVPSSGFQLANVFNTIPSQIAIPTFLMTDDSMLVLRLLSSSHNPALNLLSSHHEKGLNDKSLSKKEGKKLTPGGSTHYDERNRVESQSNIRIISVNEWPKDLVHQVYFARVTDSGQVVNGVYDSVGGLPSYLYRIALGIHKTDTEMQKELYSKDLHLVKELRVARDEVVDISNRHSTAQEKVDFERHRRQQFYIRDILASEFPREMLAFQWKMNHFLSLPILEKLRIESKTKAAYFVTVLETIRILLSKEYWAIETSHLSKINHPVILGLLDCKLFSIRFNPTTIQPYDRLTSNLLQSFINEKFEGLSVIDRIKYNSIYAENSKHLKQWVVHLTKYSN